MESHKHKHLWDINDGWVEENSDTQKFDGWDKFINGKPWTEYEFYDDKPAYWVWLNPDSGIGEEIFFGESDPHNKLTLVYLELPQLRTHTVSINVNVE